MLGLRLTTVKLAVFALCAGIAGIGGVLIAGLSTQVTPDAFSFFQSLPLLLLIMAGGVGMVSGALFGAATLGLFGALGQASLMFSRISGLLPGLVGIGLGQQPNGVAADIASGLRGLSLRRSGASGAISDNNAGQLAVSDPVDAWAVAWEWEGLDGPLTRAQSDMLDRGLGIGANR